MAVLETRQMGSRTWYRRGQFWYTRPSGSAGAHELKLCANPECAQAFFGVRQRNRVGNLPRFCSIRCSREGSFNPQWAGSAVRYRAAHFRVAKARGKASECTIPGCVTADGYPAAFHWASVTGNLADVSDYMAMCVFHHRAFDWAKILGMAPEEALARVGRIPAEAQRQRSSERC